MDELKEKVIKALRYRLSELVNVTGTKENFVKNLRGLGIDPKFNGRGFCVELGDHVVNIKRDHSSSVSAQYQCFDPDHVSCEVSDIDTVLTYLKDSKGVEEMMVSRIKNQQERFRIVDEILMEAEGKDKSAWEPKPMPHLGGSDIENEELANRVFPVVGEVTPEEARAINALIGIDNAFDDDKNGEAVYPDDEETEAEVPEEAPEQEEAENPELSVEDKMAVNVVKQAKNPLEAMRVLHSLGYEASEFTKYGIEKEAVEEYQKTLE